MTEQDKEQLKTRLKELRSIIKAEHSKKKWNRDEKAIAEAKKSIAEINASMVSIVKKDAEKAGKEIEPDVRKRFKEAFGMGEAEAVMDIATVEELKAAWPIIRRSNINIRGPKEVKDALTVMMRKDRAKIKIKGFRPK